MFLMNTLRSLRYCKEPSSPSHCTWSFPSADSLFPPWKALSTLQTALIQPTLSSVLLSFESYLWRCWLQVVWRHCLPSLACLEIYYWLQFHSQSRPEYSLVSFASIPPTRRTHRSLHHSTLLIPHLQQSLRWFIILPLSLSGKSSL